MPEGEVRVTAHCPRAECRMFTVTVTCSTRMPASTAKVRVTPMGELSGMAETVDWRRMTGSMRAARFCHVAAVCTAAAASTNPAPN